MGVIFWIRAGWNALLGRDDPVEGPVERKFELRVTPPAQIHLYGLSKSGEKLHIARNVGARETFECGVPIPPGLRMLSTDPHDESKLCQNCLAIVRQTRGD